MPALAPASASPAAWQAVPARLGIPHVRAAVRPLEDAVLTLRGITLSFGGVTALSDIDLDVAEGEILAIIGPNGAGKSSLINVISGVYRPDRGSISIGKTLFSEVPANRVAKLGIARTYQNLALFKGLSVLNNIVAGRSAALRSNFIEQVLNLPRSRNEARDARERANLVIEKLHLGRVRDHLVGGLSYGLQKRVELARALVAEPRILLLDEPMAGVTPSEKQDLAGYVRAARDTFGVTVVLIEHDIGVVMGISDRIAVLDYGRKIADGPPDVVRVDQGVIDAYLGVVHEDETYTQGGVAQ